jgi:predicted MFS family arabinose efflux permease
VTPSLRIAALGLAVGLVLADSSIVILALPDIIEQLDVSIPDVAWVLTLFNLVLAVAAVPAAYGARRLGAGRVCAIGLVIFSGASLACGLADSLEVLLAARAVQALGGAAAICAALELLPSETGSEVRAARVWAAAGVVGAALGPAVGGLLTQAISWEAIFLVQAPLALLAVPAALRRADLQPADPAGRPDILANVALGLVSAALAAALFLIVLMLIDGWLIAPIGAAAAVSIMPLAAILAGRLASGTAVAPRAAAGALLIAGGLAALGLLPGAHVAWTVLPQVAIGLGLGLTVSALTERALAGRARQAVHGGWTIAARHAGVVLGIVLLTPLFVADLTAQEAAAERSGTDLLLEAEIPLESKVQLGAAITRELDATGEQLPDLGPAFRANRPADAGQAAAFDRLEAALDEELRRAGTHAFSRSFLVAAALALAALVPIALARERIPL